MSDAVARSLRLITFCLASHLALAAPQDLAAVQDAVANWLDAQLAPTAGASYRLGEIDNRLRLDGCQRMDLQLPQGYRLVGKTMIRVRCVEGARWAINYPVTISIMATYYVASRPLASGRTLLATDLAPQQGDLAQLPGSVVLDPATAVGRVLNSAVSQGGPLRLEMLRAATSVRQNQRVRVLFQLDGLEVSNEGVALNNAAVGEVVRVRVGNNQIVSGIALDNGMVQATQ
ncbi:flagellar basal body P-ring biosynthesis protein FlgA [Chitiniphilus shinanonensis]|uniref:Flagella basal body P-ring formation protein FlgA n=1 Tax=Chitiniphilus shinanonensis TaxID=553088 RepID=A0ABQ6BMG5_9NEIS|nr:flagellar basal body P-ring formation chaperone FlgA [Chitiniphilus shinanonensis]GLS03118.1 flagellar basal body P-ring biosynthesis protein FlgA [Chitiniphilus shinanonensis]